MFCTHVLLNRRPQRPQGPGHLPRLGARQRLHRRQVSDAAQVENEVVERDVAILEGMGKKWIHRGTHIYI